MLFDEACCLPNSIGRSVDLHAFLEGLNVSNTYISRLICLDIDLISAMVVLDHFFYYLAN